MTVLVLGFVFSLITTLVIVRYKHFHNHITADHDFSGVQKFHASSVPRIGGLGLVRDSFTVTYILITQLLTAPENSK